MGCNSVRTQLPQKTLGQASIPTLLGNFGQVYGKAQISFEILNPSSAIYFLKHGLKKNGKGFSLETRARNIYVKNFTNEKESHFKLFIKSCLDDSCCGRLIPVVIQKQRDFA